jgi:hypothetical protein
LEDSLDLSRVKMVNDLLQIEPLERKDYGVYSCLFVDEYGEKKLQFKIDEKLVEDEDVAYLDSNNLIAPETHPGSVSSLDAHRLVARMADLSIDVTAVANFKNRIKIKCRNQFGIIIYHQ